MLKQNLYYNRGLVPPVRLSITSFVLCIFSIGMALGVFFALSFLLYIQVIFYISSFINIRRSMYNYPFLIFHILYIGKIYSTQSHWSRGLDHREGRRKKEFRPHITHLCVSVRSRLATKHKTSN